MGMTYNSRRVVDTRVGTWSAVMTPSTGALLASNGINSRADGSCVGASEQESCGREEGDELHFEIWSLVWSLVWSLRSVFSWKMWKWRVEGALAVPFLAAKGRSTLFYGRS